jgi:1-acyl-sn-glycerol-3-phosphate acyltransferase
LIRSLWVYLWGSLATIWVGSGVVFNGMLKTRALPRVCRAAPRRWSGAILWAAGTRVELEGAEHLRTDGPQVLVANHESFFDVFSLAVHLPVEYRFVAKEELGRIPIFGAAWRTCGHISINRQDRNAAVGSLDEAGRRIREEKLTIIMFPEGTRSATGKLARFKKGAFVLALQMGVPVVPVAILGSRHVLPRSGWPVRKGTIRIRIGAPIPVEGLAVGDRDSLMQRAWDEIARLKGEIPAESGNP